MIQLLFCSGEYDDKCRGNPFYKQGFSKNVFVAWLKALYNQIFDVDFLLFARYSNFTDATWGLLAWRHNYGQEEKRAILTERPQHGACKDTRRLIENGGLRATSDSDWSKSQIFSDEIQTSEDELGSTNNYGAVELEKQWSQIKVKPWRGID